MGNEVINMARTFTLECLRIMMERFGANMDYIDPSIFYYRHIGQLSENAASGKAVMTPNEMCDDALRTYRDEFLGLACPVGRFHEMILNNRNDIRFGEWSNAKEIA